MEKKHFAFPDIAKGIGIILIVFYHSMIPAIRNQPGYSFLNLFIEAFHLPLFFFLSGWLFELNVTKYAANKWKTIKNKFLRLMVPYFSFSILYYLIINAALRIDALQKIISAGAGGYEKYSFLESVMQILTFNDSMAKSLWFLYALFIITVFNILFPKLLKHPLFFIFLIPLGYLASMLPDSCVLIFRTVQYAFYFSFARFAFRFTDMVLEMKKSMYLLLAVGAVILNSLYVIFFRNPFKLEFAKALAPFYPLVRPLAAVVFVTALCVGSHYLANCRISAPLSYLGKNSMVIYLIHAPLLTQSVSALCYKVLKALPAIITCIVSTAVGVVIPLLINLVIVRIPILNTILLGAPMKRKEK